MSFGGNDNQTYIPPPPLPPEPPPMPQFATNMGRPQNRGKPYGGTLITNPLSPGPVAETTRRSLLTA
jgi:hypothetical protein